MPHDILLLSLFPHMHLRGKSFRYEAIYPDGQPKCCSIVPHYDFMWQHQYVLRSPAFAGRNDTAGRGDLRQFGGQPEQSDPARLSVRLQTTDEMFNGWFEFADLPTPGHLRLPLAAAGVSLVLVLHTSHRRWKARTARLGQAALG